MQRKADEKFWPVQIDVVKVLYGVDELVYKVGAGVAYSALLLFSCKLLMAKASGA